MSSNKANMIQKNILDLMQNVDLDNIDTTHISKLYKLDLDVCKSRSNRNCVSNPRCLKGLGQASWLINDDSDSNDCDDNEFSLKKSHFCGLRNLGATCYLNTFLQLWYHNVELRKAFFKWRPNNWYQDVLQNPIMSLQLVFSLMQFSQRGAVDPAPFIKCLKLDESQEQDTHEFSNLFISFIQNKLSCEFDKSIHNSIDQQYSMKIAYVIKCNQCKFVSENETNFFELLLRVKGFKTIEECISDYLKEESLDGNNQYACRVCKNLQDAKRFIELRRLPPVLNLQLLRFDSQNGRSKKINSFIKFPDKLEMKEFVGSNFRANENQSYQLFAVLIHEGQTAHSGHYITFIKRENIWFKFNDEHVEKLKDFNLKIDSDDDFVDSDKKNSQEKKDKTEKGYHKSKNAYMLVYRLESEIDSELPMSYSECSLPDYLTTEIEKDNEAFSKEEEEFVFKKSVQRENELSHQKMVKEIYSNIEVAIDNHDHDVISKESLINLFEAKVREDVTEVKNEKLLCIHKKLEMGSSFKSISKESADLIYSQYGGGPRIHIPSFFCRECVEYKINLARVKNQIDIDIKVITSSLKFKNSDDDKMFWIGKESFKKWRQLRLNLIENQFNQNDTENDSGDDKFNNDILCQHGNLSTDSSKMRQVNEAIWTTLKKHFPESLDYIEGSPTCAQCSEIDQSNQRIRDNNFSIAVTQRNELEHLLNQDKPRYWSDLLPGNVYHIISTKFYNTWRKFLAHPNTSAAPECIQNNSILCESHLLFLFPPSQDDYVGFDKKYVILTEEEYNILNTFYYCSSDVAALMVENNFEINPEFCQKCFKSYVEDEKRKRYIYTNVSIYIHKVVCDEEDVENPENANNDATKKMKTIESFESSPKNFIELNHVASAQTGPLKNLDGPRRSSRRRRYKNELEIKVSSSDKLKDIKVKIMQHFHVATYDQTLIVKDKVLFSHHNNWTLAELEIEPYSVIILRVDDKTDDNTAMDSSEVESKSISTEAGFKGTQLQLL